MDMPVNVPVDNPNADTEWYVFAFPITLFLRAVCSLTIHRNDILRKHGIIPEKPPSPTPMIEEAILEAAQREHENRLENKDLDELDALEDEEEERFLAKYRFADPAPTEIYIYMYRYITHWHHR